MILNKPQNNLGLRQISDLRGLPGGEDLARYGINVTKLLRRMMIAAEVAVLEKFLLNGNRVENFLSCDVDVTLIFLFLTRKMTRRN